MGSEIIVATLPYIKAGGIPRSTVKPVSHANL